MKLLNFNPILFQQEMVKAILAGLKTETRRIIKPQPIPEDVKMPVPVKDFVNQLKKKENLGYDRISTSGTSKGFYLPKCPYGQHGDILWVRENYMAVTSHWEGKEEHGYAYQASDKDWGKFAKWKPSIHMPKEACRIFLLLKEVKVERLQDISENDAIAEGVSEIRWSQDVWKFPVYVSRELTNHSTDIPASNFASLWQSINGASSWYQNPWVWVLKYEVLTTKGISDLKWSLLDRKYDGALIAQSEHAFLHNKKK